MPALALFGFSLWAGPAAGQNVLDGQVMLAGSPLEVATVVLHSVSPDSAGEVDSMRVGVEGRFAFELPGGLHDEQRTQVYFASVRHQGVLYFGQAVALAQQLDSLYVIEVFDAEEAPLIGLSLSLAVRNVILEAADGTWLVTDLLQIRNDRDRTIVAADSGVVWSHPLPPGATEFEVGEGDLASDAVGFEDGRVVVRAPLPPGERLLLIRYRLGPLPAELPVSAPTDVMELLIKEPAPFVLASPLEAVESVPIEGSSYRRFTGRGLSGVTVMLEETDPPEAFPVGWMAVLFAFLLTGAGLFVYYRPVAARTGPAPAAKPTSTEDDGELARGELQGRGAIIMEVARLDEHLEAIETGDAAELGELQARRAELMERLRAHR